MGVFLFTCCKNYEVVLLSFPFGSWGSQDMKRLSKLLTDNNDEASMQPQGITSSPIHHSEEGCSSLTSSSCPLLFSLNGTLLFFKVLRIFALIVLWQENFPPTCIQICDHLSASQRGFSDCTERNSVPQHTFALLNFPSQPFSPPRLVLGIQVLIASFHHKNGSSFFVHSYIPCTRMNR